MKGVFIKLIIIEFIFNLIAVPGLTGCKRKSASTPTKAKPKSIYEAAMLSDKSSLEDFLNQGISVNSRDKMGATPLHWAATFGNKEIVEFLIAEGADINAKKKNGGTPLGASTMGREDFLDIAELLIENGANVNIQDRNGSSILHDAVRNGQPEMIKLFLSNGANPKIKNNNGQTPLDLAEVFTKTKFRWGSTMYKRRGRFEECRRILQEFSNR